MITQILGYSKIEANAPSRSWRVKDEIFIFSGFKGFMDFKPVPVTTRTIRASSSMMVLWERELENGIWTGLTDNYIRVYSKSDEDLTNQLLPVKLT